MSLLTARRP